MMSTPSRVICSRSTRERIQPQRGSRGADLWYVTQVYGFAWRATAMWAPLLGAAFVARTVLDWFVPTADFTVRASVLTMTMAWVFFGVGVLSTWRGRSLRASAFAGVVTALTTAAISIVAAVARLHEFRLSLADAEPGLRIAMDCWPIAPKY